MMRRLPAILIFIVAASVLAGLTTSGYGKPSPSERRGFSISVSYSAKAAAALRQRHEGVIAWASWFGDPSSAGQRNVNEVGQIDLGQQRVAHSGPARMIVLSGAGFVERRLARVKDHTIEVNVNVYSARRSGPDNILDCAIYQGPLAKPQAKPLELACKLINENDRS